MCAGKNQRMCGCWSVHCGVPLESTIESTGVHGTLHATQTLCRSDFDLILKATGDWRHNRLFVASAMKELETECCIHWNRALAHVQEIPPAADVSVLVCFPCMLRVCGAAEGGLCPAAAGWHV